MEDVMLEQARQVLRMEAEAVLEQVERIDEHFKAAVEMIMACPGRTVITGMGKSGIIGRKMAATLASTGTPSFYLHPAEGIHGDLGMVTEGDVVIALSNSGETGEVLHILPSLRRIGAKLIAMVGNPNSTLAKNSDIVLNVGVTREACPLGLAPTSSTTAALAYGDALALALLSKRFQNANLRPASLRYSIREVLWGANCFLLLKILCTAARKTRLLRLISACRTHFLLLPTRGLALFPLLMMTTKCWAC